ncbi:MAG: PDZ domain-containing protein, partial [Gammaproteobacteria bacterium]|nr:PDZ domain-containing protein [Gammaproteobacteria bacterium]
MFDTLDAYLEAALTSRRVDRQQRLNHIGIAAAVRDGRHLVAAVLDGSPASAAGLRRGDHLLAVNGAPYHPV